MTVMMAAEESGKFSTTYFSPPNSSLPLSLLPGEEAGLEDISEM